MLSTGKKYTFKDIETAKAFAASLDKPELKNETRGGVRAEVLEERVLFPNFPATCYTRKP